jgi:cytochrome c nitrite reductase small subunit
MEPSLMNEEQKITEKEIPAKKKIPNWLRISIFANILILVVLAVAAASLAVLHQSDTNPKFCATCHNMQANVNSYLTSNHLDNLHAQAGVQCKQCHNYPVSAEIASGIKFITGNYDKSMPKRKYGNNMCLKCHISYDHIAQQTAFLDKNPHDSHQGEMACSTCHISHGNQIDYCAQCHDHGQQKMIEELNTPKTN